MREQFLREQFAFKIGVTLLSSMPSFNPIYRHITRDVRGLISRFCSKNNQTPLLYHYITNIGLFFISASGSLFPPFFTAFFFQLV